VKAVAAEASGEVCVPEAAEGRDSDLCRKIAACIEHQHVDFRRALQWLDRAARSLPPGHRALASRILITQSVVNYRMGRLGESMRLGERALSLAREEGDEALQAYALAMLSNPLVAQGDFSRANQCCSEAAHLYERVGDLSGQAVAHGNLAANYQNVGALEPALRHHELSLELHSRLGYATGAAITRNNMAEVELMLGRPERAVDLLECVLAELPVDEHPALVGCAHVGMAKAHIRTGKLAAAASSLEEGCRLLNKADAGILLLEGDLEKARLDLRLGQLQAAKRRARLLLEQTRVLGARYNEANVLLTLGEIHLAEGREEEARDVLEQSARICDEMGLDYEGGLALLNMARATRNQPDNARSILREAIERLQKVGAIDFLTEAEGLYSQLQATGGRDGEVQESTAPL
jgi:tetratricopeptide (TPR) repeat protein